jgi:hypothetical protein
MGSTTSLIILAKKAYSSGRLRYPVQVRQDPFCFRYNQDHGLRQLQRQDHRSQLLAGAGGSYFKFCDTITEIQLLELLARALAKIRVDLDHCEWPVKYLISILQVYLLKRYSILKLSFSLNNIYSPRNCWISHPNCDSAVAE